MQRHYFNVGHDHFLYILFQFMIHSHPAIWHYIKGKGK
jgi:hypothetical protein